AGLGDRIEAILDGGACQVGVESTIAEVGGDGCIRILRPGAISGGELLMALRRAGLHGRLAHRMGGKPILAPGLLDQHYSPRTALEICAKVTPAIMKLQPAGTAFILRRKSSRPNRPGVFAFSRTGSAREVAHNLYHVLREADAGGFRKIV